MAGREFTKNFISICHQTASGLKIRMESPIHYVTTVQGGFHYESYDPKAHLQAWNIMRMAECARLSSWWKAEEFKVEPFMQITQLGRLFFTASVGTEIAEELYDQSREKRPVTLSSEVDQIGHTSFKEKILLYLPSLDKPVASVNTQFVIVDPKTRKPAPPADWWREKYIGMMPPDVKPLGFPSLVTPENAEVIEGEVRVMPSDVDPYMHLNWAAYCRLSTNLYGLHHLEKYGTSKKGLSFLFRTVKSVQVKYKMENRIGDILLVKFWQDSENVNKFCFQFTKDSVIVNECSVEFYP